MKEKILLFFKPDVMLRKFVLFRILQEFFNFDYWEIIEFKKIMVPEELAKRHYSHLETRPFFPWLIKYVTFSPALVFICQGEAGMIGNVREKLGNTIVEKAKNGNIRGNYGLCGGINCIHASDSIESGEKEISLWREYLHNEKYILPLEIDIDKIKSLQSSELPHNTLNIRKLCHEIGSSEHYSEDLFVQLKEIIKLDFSLENEEKIQDFAELVLACAIRQGREK